MDMNADKKVEKMQRFLNNALVKAAALCILFGCVSADATACKRPATSDEIAIAQQIATEGRLKDHPEEFPPFQDYFMIRDVKRSEVCGSVITVFYEVNEERAYQPTYFVIGRPSKLVVNITDRTYKMEGLSEFKNSW
jgi:hypothetical protein